MLLSPLYFMVREMTKKHLAAINRGRKAAGLKPIRMKKKTKEKAKIKKKAPKKLPKLMKHSKDDFDYEDRYYIEYKKLGGKKSRSAYQKNQDIFIDHTFDIFIHGDPSRYKSRKAAFEGVKKAAKINNAELNKIFHSIDNVDAYT